MDSQYGWQGLKTLLLVIVVNWKNAAGWNTVDEYEDCSSATMERSSPSPADTPV